MRHFNEKIDSIRVGFHYVLMELFMMPLFITLIIFDAIKGRGIISSIKTRCLYPIKVMIRNEVTWHYRQELDPIFRKAKGL